MYVSSTFKKCLSPLPSLPFHFLVQRCGVCVCINCLFLFYLFFFFFSFLFQTLKMLFFQSRVASSVLFHFHNSQKSFNFHFHFSSVLSQYVSLSIFSCFFFCFVLGGFLFVFFLFFNFFYCSIVYSLNFCLLSTSLLLNFYVYYVSVFSFG